MSIRVVCTKCRKKNKLRDELARSEAVCRKCGTSLAEPTPVQATEPVVVEPPPEEPDDGSLAGSRWNKWSLAAAREHWIGRSLERKRELERDGGDDRTRRGRRKAAPVNRRPRQTAGARCRECEDGKMRPRTVHRLGRRLALAGYILLLPAILGLIVNLVILATAAFDLAKTVSDVTRIPVPTVETVMRIQKIPDHQLALMTAEQQQTVRAARLATAGATLGNLDSRSGTAGIALIAWLSVAMIGLFLARKKHILRCTTCETIVTDPG